MIVNISIVGDREIEARFEQLPAIALQALYVKVQTLAFELEALVKTGKLNGQVLNRVTGALARSINNKVDKISSAVIGRVFSSGDVKYAAIHEYGGQTSPHVIEPKKASALAFLGKGGAMVFAKKVNHPGSKMPERSFMRSSLHDMSTRISTEMKEAVVQAVIKQVKG